MALKDDLEKRVKDTFKDSWSVRDGRGVPAPSDLTMGNDSIQFSDAVVLYADMDGSTDMVDTHSWQFCGEVYKNYLFCAGRIIRDEGGEITAYDGDRIMAIFIGENLNSRATRAAMKLNWVVQKLIQPALTNQYPHKTFTLKHTIGIDRSEIRAARTGVRGDSDLVWIGRAANYAAKLTAIPGLEAIRCTREVYTEIDANLKTYPTGNAVWSNHSWAEMHGIRIYYCDANWQL